MKYPHKVLVFALASFMASGCLLMIELSELNSEYFDAGTDSDSDGDSDCLNEEDSVSFTFDKDIDNISVNDGYVYLLGGKDYDGCGDLLAILDATSDSSISLASGVNDVFYDGYHMAFSGGYMYVVSQESYSHDEPTLFVFNASNPNNDPSMVAWQELYFHSTRILVEDGNAYIGIIDSEENCGIVVYDVSNPSSPIYRGETKVGEGEVTDMSLKGDFLYCAIHNNDFVESGSVAILDVSNPNAPLSTMNAASHDVPAQAVFATGERLYVGGGHSSISNDDPTFFAVYSISDSPNLEKLGELEMEDVPFSIAADEGVAYLATGWSLEAYNVTDPGDISFISKAYNDAKQVVFDPEDSSVLYTASGWANDVYRFSRCSQPDSN